MKRNPFNSYVLALGTFSLFLLWSSCSSTQGAGREGLNTSTYQSLSDFLRHDPKVQMSGSGDNARVYIRGTNDLNGMIEPLFVIDGTVVGNTYNQVARLVDVNNIASVKVLAPAQASGPYGQRGEFGVVEIRTKSKN